MMIKELYEAIDNLWANLAYTEYTENDSIRDRNLLIEAVKRLEAIDNATLSEALKKLRTIKIKCHPNSNPSPLVDEALEVVERALIKAREQEKVLKFIFKKQVDINEIKILLSNLKHCDDVERCKRYNASRKVGYKLKQEEFELLKRYCDTKGKSE